MPAAIDEHDGSAVNPRRMLLAGVMSRAGRRRWRLRAGDGSRVYSSTVDARGWPDPLGQQRRSCSINSPALRPGLPGCHGRAHAHRPQEGAYLLVVRSMSATRRMTCGSCLPPYLALAQLAAAVLSPRLEAVCLFFLGVGESLNRNRAVCNS